MNIIRDADKVNIKEKTAVTLGKFDGFAQRTSEVVVKSVRV